jgi:transcriptional regulator with XRE-family HTH domain
VTAPHPVMAALRAERQRKKLTQRALAAHIGWSLRTIANAERGIICPKLEFVADYATGVGAELRVRRRDDADMKEQK